jgi:hypothetical protein
MKLTLVLIASVLVLSVIGEPSTASSSSSSSLTRNKIRGRIRRRADNDDYGEYTMVDTLRVVPNEKNGSFDRKESHYVVSDPDSNYQPEEHISTNVISGGGMSEGSSSHYHHSSKQSIGTDQALEEAQKRYLSLIGGIGDDSDDESDNDDDDDEASEANQVSAASFDPSKRSLSNDTLDRFQPKQKVNDHIDLPVEYAGRYNREKEEEPRNLYQSKGNPIDHHRHHHYHEQQQQQQQQHGHHPDKTDTSTTTVTTTTTTTTTKSDSKKNNGKNGGKKNKQKKKGKGGKNNKNNNKNKNKKKSQPVTNITDNSENVNASKNINQTINIPSTESRKAVSLFFFAFKLLNNAIKMLLLGRRTYNYKQNNQ